MTTIAELKETRCYARSALHDTMEEVVAGCVESLRRYGFCVIDDVIPTDAVPAVCDEVRAAPAKAHANREAGESGIVRTGRLRVPSAPVCDLVWMPEFTKHLAHPATCAVARAILDDHIRISQFNFRPIMAIKEEEEHPGGYGGSDRLDLREWHTDWPHDLSAYGAGEGNYPDGGRNAGCIRQPFPDICMCLTMIHYLTDGDETSGGTWIVPGSHRDPRNPRGPHDGMNVSAPIPGEMQVTAPAGSVFMQDTRCWHCSAMHNPGRDRIPIVSRWCPWWLSVQDFGGGNLGYLGIEEYEALPEDAKPLLRHLCEAVEDRAQPPMLERAQAAGDRTGWGFAQQQEDPDNVTASNQHVHVRIPPPIQYEQPKKYHGPNIWDHRGPARL